MEHSELKSSYHSQLDQTILVLTNLLADTTQSDPWGIAFATCTRAALQAWKTDRVFSPYFHETGAIVSAHTPELKARIREHEIEPSETKYVELNTAEEFSHTMPRGVLTGPFPGWKGWWRRDGAGWIHAQKAMVSAYREACRLGVTFVSGSAGDVVSLVYDDGGRDVIGATTADRTVYRADRTILAAGAASDRLLDFKDQLRPTAWTLCHIRLTEDEAKRYRNLPVLFNVAKGFFMEPDEEKHEMKICDEHPGYVNLVPDPLKRREKRSVSFARTQIPIEAENRARAFLRDTMPQLADREVVFARVCWDTDTPDRAFLIDTHPEIGRLVVAVGGSGNGAMQMPTIGGFIVDALEGRLQTDVKDAVRWRPEIATRRDWMDTQGRFGGAGNVMDFQNVREWTDIKSRL